MSLAVALRLTALPLPRSSRLDPAPKASRRGTSPLDPCLLSRHLRRDLGLEAAACPPIRDQLRRIL
jgi:hypothetical protein